VYALLVEGEMGLGWDGRYLGLWMWVCRCARGCGCGGGGGGTKDDAMQCNLFYIYSLPPLPRIYCAMLSIHTTLFGEPRLISPIPTVLLRTSGTTMTVSP
jgi:hypothetical protein